MLIKSLPKKYEKLFMLFYCMRQTKNVTTNILCSYCVTVNLICTINTLDQYKRKQSFENIFEDAFEESMSIFHLNLEEFLRKLDFEFNSLEFPSNYENNNNSPNFIRKYILVFSYVILINLLSFIFI